MRHDQQPFWQRMLLAAWQERGGLSFLLLPLSGLLRLWLATRSRLYRAGVLPRVSLPLPVIVVGNVVAGGGGKTPVVMELVQHLRQRGLNPGVISRGYGRQTSDCREVLADSPAIEVGDEPLLIKRQAQVPVFVARQRVQAAQALLLAHPQTDVLLSDDGLQHLPLARDIEVCVFDERGLGNGRLLPAGPLREPWPRPVDLILRSPATPELGGFRVTRRLQSFARRADGSRQGLADFSLPGHPPLLALAGTARPQAFFDMLTAQGLHPDRTLELPDHFDYSQWQPPTDQPYQVLCTDKDAVKLWPRWPDVWAVGLLLHLEPGFYGALDQHLNRLLKTPLSSRDTHGHTTA